MSVKATNWAWEQDLPSGQKFILVALADHCDPAGGCFPSVRRLAERTGYGESTVRAALAALQKSGHIRVVTRFRAANGAQRSNRYYLPIPGADANYDPDDDDVHEAADTPLQNLDPLPPESSGTPLQNLDPLPPESGPLTVTRTTQIEPPLNRETRAGANAPASARQVEFLASLNERNGGSTTAVMTDEWAEGMTRGEASDEIQEALAVERAARRAVASPPTPPDYFRPAPIDALHGTLF